jgi:hypothetical protein
MSQPFRPFFRRRRAAGQPPITRKVESPWARAWRLSPERMKQHIADLNEARTAKSEEAAQLVQAVINLIPADKTYRAHELRDLFADEWGRCYDEPLTKKAAWNKVRKAMRHGMLGRDEKGLIYPRHG